MISLTLIPQDHKNLWIANLCHIGWTSLIWKSKMHNLSSTNMIPKVETSTLDFMWQVTIKMEVHWKCIRLLLDCVYMKQMNFMFIIGPHPQDLSLCIRKYSKPTKIESRNLKHFWTQIFQLSGINLIQLTLDKYFPIAIPFSKCFTCVNSFNPHKIQQGRKCNYHEEAEAQIGKLLTCPRSCKR